MPIGSLSDWTFLTGPSFGSACRVDDDHVFLTYGRYSNVIFADTDTIDVPNAEADSGADEPTHPFVQSFLVAPFKVAVIYYVFNRYIKGYIATINPSTYAVSLSSVVTLRDSLTDNPPYTDILLSLAGPMIQNGDQIQIFWGEFDTAGGVDTENQTMVIDCSGATPSAGTVTTFSTTVNLFGNGGVLHNPPLGTLSSNSLDPNGAAQFTFGSSPGAMSGSGYFEPAIALPGGLAVGAQGTTIYALRGNIIQISPPTPSFSVVSIDQLQSRTCIIAGGNKVARLVLSDNSLNSIDEEASGFSGTVVLAVRSDKSRALLFEPGGPGYTFVQLIGPVPTDDPFPYTPDTGHRLWMYKTTDGGRTWISRGITT